ncbi:MAG TPA: hypothetical protein DCX27_04155 [Balneola sp.]|nr:hypothetical protein [Balneola sp.]
MMAVPSKQQILDNLRVLEVAPSRHRVYIRKDIITPAQKAVKDRLKRSWAASLEDQLRRKANVKRSKWDV